MVDRDSRSQSSAYLTAADGTRSNAAGQALPNRAPSLEAMMLESPRAVPMPQQASQSPIPGRESSKRSSA